MSDLQFPVRTAGDLTLPNGDTVWVCQLNMMLFEEVQQKASWYAQKETRGFLKGEREYPDVLAYMKSMTVEQQCGLLAKQEYFTIERETSEKHPLPERPEQHDTSAEEFTKSVLAWEEKCKKVEEKRQKGREARWEAEMKKNRALTAGVRLDRCCLAHFQEQWGQAFIKAREMETMHRAVRCADDHTRRYFPTPAHYEDADDAVQEAIRAFFYVTLAEPKAEEIPTSPAAS